MTPTRVFDIILWGTLTPPYGCHFDDDPCITVQWKLLTKTPVLVFALKSLDDDPRITVQWELLTKTPVLVFVLKSIFFFMTYETFRKWLCTEPVSYCLIQFYTFYTDSYMGVWSVVSFWNQNLGYTIITSLILLQEYSSIYPPNAFVHLNMNLLGKG